MLAEPSPDYRDRSIFVSFVASFAERHSRSEGFGCQSDTMPPTLQSLLSIPEFRRMILSFLWFSEFRELLLTARDINEYVGRDDLLHRQLISLLSYFTGRLASPLDDVFFESRPSFREILSLASRFSTWPLVAVVGTPHVDSRRRERYGLTRVTCDGQECVLFTGNRGRDRAFFSDDHFPGSF